jgi:hypothetical protein
MKLDRRPLGYALVLRLTGNQPVRQTQALRLCPAEYWLLIGLFCLAAHYWETLLLGCRDPQQGWYQHQQLFRLWPITPPGDRSHGRSVQHLRLERLGLHPLGLQKQLRTTSSLASYLLFTRSLPAEASECRLYHKESTLQKLNSLRCTTTIFFLWRRSLFLESQKCFHMNLIRQKGSGVLVLGV